MQPLHERHDEDAPTHDDLLPGQVGGDDPGLGVAAVSYTHLTLPTSDLV